jgi:hypothetical protein
MNSSNKKTELQNLINFLIEDEVKDIKAIREDLQNAGINPDKLIYEGKELISSLIGKQKRILASERLEKMKEKLSRVVLSKSEIIQNAKEYLLNLLTGENKAALQANFRNLGDISDKEAINILNESQLLEIYSKLKAEE